MAHSVVLHPIYYLSNDTNAHVDQSGVEEERNGMKFIKVVSKGDVIGGPGHFLRSEAVQE